MFLIGTLPSIGPPAGSTLLFDWKLDRVTVEPARGFSVAMLVTWLLARKSPA
jgi:hypothetical protein